MPILIVLTCIALLILLITQFKINAFLAFLIIAILAGFLLGIDTAKLAKSIQLGIGDMFGSVAIIIVSGSMLGKLVAESGATQRIASKFMYFFGERYIQWGLMLTAFIIGIPIFYNVGFMIVVPLIFSVVHRYKLPVLYVGFPMLAALSVTHGFLPPHPSPATLVVKFNADMGTTLFYGIVIALPTVILAGPLFSRRLKRINAPLPNTFQPTSIDDDQLPSLSNSVISSLLPVIILTVTTILVPLLQVDGAFKKILVFLNSPEMVMLLSLGIATYTLGISNGMTMKKVMNIYADAVKDIAMLLLILSGAGAFKQILIDSGVDKEIALLLNNTAIHPLIVGWLIACVLRVCVGSATVAGITAAGIMVPLVNQPNVNPNLMVLSIGAGSLMFSHVNDSGFWMFKEYFNLSIKDTIKSWSVMETLVGILGLIGVLIINALI